MRYKQMQVYTPIKNIVQNLKTELDFKNESEVIAYLYAIYKYRYKAITLEEHKQALKEKDDILNQQQL
ncbi:hypothetical protein D3C77_762670 [compost metagenome]